MRSVRTFPAKRVKHFNRSSADVVTFPVNMAGAIRLCMRNAPPGHKISLRYGELVFPDGSLNALTSACGQIKSGNGGPCSPPIAYQTDTYIAKGGQEECFSVRCHSEPDLPHGYAHEPPPRHHKLWFRFAHACARTRT